MDPSELDNALEELETRLDRLRALYDQYFMGIEKLEPAVARKDVDRRIWILRREKIRNTAKRFKLQTLIQRYNTFQQYWLRICREIEAGTYKRHLLRAEKAFGPNELLTIASRRRYRNRGTTDGEAANSPSEPPVPTDQPSAAPSDRPSAVPSDRPSAMPSERPSAVLRAANAETFSTSEPGTATAGRAPTSNPPARRVPLASLDLDLDFAPADQPAATRPGPRAVTKSPAVAPGSPAPAAKSVAKAPPPAKSAPGPLDETRLRNLHERLLAAKRQTNDNSPLSFDRLVKSLKDAESRLRERHANRTIDFDVVIKDGKAIVKPILR